MIRNVTQWKNLCAASIRGQTFSAPSPDQLPDRGIRFADQLGDILRPGMSIVDVGCGHGRLPIGLDLTGLLADCDYHGFDVQRGCIHFCRSAFAVFPRVRFDVLDTRNARYNPDGTRLPHAVGLPRPSVSADLVVASSLFTHLETCPAALRHFRELARIVRPGGTLYATWFRSPPNDPHAHADRTVYAEDWIRDLYHEHGLSIFREAGGESTRWHDQWQLSARRDT